MREKYCSDCYFSDMCGCLKVCEDYTPLTEEAVSEEVDDMIEIGRIAFRAEWLEYIESFYS